MDHWRHSSSKQTATAASNLNGVDLSLTELLETKRFLDSFEIPNKQKVKTHLLGGFISHHKGRGMDFDEARPYQMGDDIRSIDWRVTARTGKAHTKIYREERERPVFVILDQSSSMMFGTRQQFKSVQAAKLAALLMWRTLSEGNRFGALLFDDQHHTQFKPASSRKNCLQILQAIVTKHNQQIARLYKQKPLEESNQPLMAETLRRARHLAKPGSLVFVVSDFLQFDSSCEHHLIRLSQHNDLHLIKVFDEIERHLPPAGIYGITDGQHHATINTASRNARESFSDHYQAQFRYLEELSAKHRMRHIAVGTELAIQHVLQQNASTMGFNNETSTS